MKFVFCKNVVVNLEQITAVEIGSKGLLIHFVSGLQIPLHGDEALHFHSILPGDLVGTKELAEAKAGLEGGDVGPESPGA